jgi:hypothetical protein
MNPIIQELVRHIQSGKQVGRIHPDLSAEPNKKVTFYFGDNTSAVLQTESDHKTFMVWWKDLIRMSRKIQDLERLK